VREPRFWWRGGNPWPARLLSPAGALYGTATILRRWSHQAYRAPVPVVVAGGVTLGGAGKTPLALALAELLAARSPHFLSRGYGGSEAGPLRVDPSRHGAKDVGDEPLLLAARAPTWIARDRVAGAKAAAAAGAGLVILDDGFQNPFLAKDLAFLAIDGESGLGNGRVFPAGPLREPFATALRRAQAVVLIGEDRAGIAGLIADRCPILPARLVAADPAAVAGKPAYAFAGIGRPEKFFASLEGAGAVIAGRRSFPDHHPFSESEIAEVLAAAAALNATPITTAKDRLRLPAAVRDQVKVFEVILAFDNPAAVDAVLGPSLRGDPRSARNAPRPGPR
jgi:tetraacyldisaccharide 4'-kinase